MCFSPVVKQWVKVIAFRNCGRKFRIFQKIRACLSKNEINQDVPLQSHKRDVLDLYLDSKM